MNRRCVRTMASSLRNPSIFGIAIFGVALTTLVPAGCERASDEQMLRELLTARTLGLAYLEESKLAEAEVEFRRVVDLERREALGYANLGLLYLLVDDRSNAEIYITQALEITPEDPDARYVLAQIYLHTDREPEALAELESILERSPEHVRTLYALAELAAGSDAPEAWARRERYLARIAEVTPTNLLVRLQLVDLLLQSGKADEAAQHLEHVGPMFAELPAEARLHYDEALRLALASRAADAVGPAAALHASMRQTTEYGVGIPDLVWQGLQRTGFPAFSRGFALEVEDELARAQLAAIRFTDVTSSVGLDAGWVPDEGTVDGPGPGGLLAAGDYDGDGDVDLYASGRPVAGGGRTGRTGLVLRNEAGRFTAVSEEVGLAPDGREEEAAFGDYD
ncbi:MAG: tetratricopeptide repeat protein, partial [Gemmatimonadetes bacterium]|nr:tetratricopeptide repeat protein [Gemmatimonadota bacterium]